MVFNHEYVITLDELDDIDNIITALEKKRNALDEDEIVLSTDTEILSVLRYQNPIQNNCLVLSPAGESKISNIVIYSAQGKVIFNYENPDHRDEWNFDFTGKSPGMYFVKVVTAKTTSVIRIIKL